MLICKIYIVRHGESEANRDGTAGGDSLLTEKGRQQAEETKNLLSGVHFDAVYSSDLQRAVTTAAIITGKSVPELHQLAAFRERDFGNLEGKPNEDWFVIMQSYEARYASLPFEERLQYEYGPTIESDRAISDRFLAGLRQAARQHPGQTILIGTHAGPIRVLLMKLGFADFLTAGSFRNAGYIELSYDGEAFRIEKVVGVEDVDTPHS